MIRLFLYRNFVRHQQKAFDAHLPCNGLMHIEFNTNCTMFSYPYLLYKAHTCFVRTSWPTSRRFKLLRTLTGGTAVAQWLRWCATNLKVAGSIPAGVIGTFHCHKILPIALWQPGVDYTSNKNEYQEHFLGVKATSA